MLLEPTPNPSRSAENASTAAPRPEPDDPAATAVRAVLAEGLHWLRVNESAAAEGEAEGVHRLRTTARRLRSAMATFRPLTEPAWADRMGDGLKWLGHKLGEVRDNDVLRERLANAAAEAGTAEALAPLFGDLDGRHARTSEALREALRDDRFKDLTTLLAEGLAATRLRDDAWLPCREALPPLVNEAWKALRRAGRALSAADPDDEFHEVRKLAKRARYAAESVKNALGPAVSSDAARFAKRARDVQDVLGQHQDAVVASALIREAALARPDLGPFNFAAGRLLERELRESADTRARFFKVWPRLDRKKTTRWLKA